MPDLELKCTDCGGVFVHSEGEQEWMREKWKDDYNAPIRCKNCRTKRREQKMRDQRDTSPLRD